jgi:RimJ/RimL family protein N-acetyltransferase
MSSFRTLEDSDFQTLFSWLQEPHLKEWWNDGDDTIEKVESHYSGDPEFVFRFIFQSDLGDPLGYFQYYLEQGNVVGIDQFLGDSSLLNKGIGTAAVKAFTELVIKCCSPNSIILDPDPKNKRAIRCYEKAGFVFQKIKLANDGNQAYIMKMDTNV